MAKRTAAYHFGLSTLAMYLGSTISFLVTVYHILHADTLQTDSIVTRCHTNQLSPFKPLLLTVTCKSLVISLHHIAPLLLWNNSLIRLKEI